VGDIHSYDEVSVNSEYPDALRIKRKKPDDDDSGAPPNGEGEDKPSDSDQDDRGE
jgi:hypothetical protein